MEHDISNERMRVYTYPDGREFRIFNPATVRHDYNDQYAQQDRVTSLDGSTVTLSPGWRALSTYPQYPAEEKPDA